MPERIRLSRAKGWKMPPNTVSVARPSVWGNPYPVSIFGRDLALRLFEETAQGMWSPSLVAHLSDQLCDHAYRLHCGWRLRFGRRIGGHPIEAARAILRGRNLGCWCGLEDPCHADIWLRLANPQLHPPWTEVKGDNR